MGVIERRQREKEMRRELAIEAAMKIYNEEGYHAVTMEKIASRSELSRAALYLYFKNKNEILVSAIVAHTEYFSSLLEDLYEKRTAVKERLLDELWECFIKYYEYDPAVFNAALYFHQSEIMHKLPDELRDILYKSEATVVNLQHRIIEYGVQEGVFIQSNPQTLAEVVWTSFFGISQLARSKQMMSRKNHLPATRNLAVQILKRGIVSQFDELKQD